MSFNSCFSYRVEMWDWSVTDFEHNIFHSSGLWKTFLGNVSSFRYLVKVVLVLQNTVINFLDRNLTSGRITWDCSGKDCSTQVKLTTIMHSTDSKNENFLLSTSCMYVCVCTCGVYFILSEFMLTLSKRLPFNLTSISEFSTYYSIVNKLSLLIRGIF